MSGRRVGCGIRSVRPRVASSLVNRLRRKVAHFVGEPQDYPAQFWLRPQMLTTLVNIFTSLHKVNSHAPHPGLRRDELAT